MKIKTPLIIKAGKTEVDQIVSQRITSARYLMICGIVVHHMTPQLALADLGNTPFHIFYGFITNALTRFMLPVSLILTVTACFTVIIFKMEDMFWLKLAAPVLVWPILSLLQNTPAGTFILKHARHGFCIFLTHALFLFVLDGLYWRFLCNVLPIELYWLSGPLVIIVSCELFDRLVRRCFPGIAPHLFGGR